MDGAADAATEGADDAADEGADDLSCAAQSFTPGTGVVLASGATVALGSVTVGEQVLATDPVTGATTAETVAHVWVDRDDDLMDVTVVSDGKPSVVHTTAHHPFWDVTRHAWVEADQLTPGDLLRSLGGSTVTYTSETVVPGYRGHVGPDHHQRPRLLHPHRQRGHRTRPQLLQFAVRACKICKSNAEAG